MPGIEIKGTSKRANYRHGGRTGYADGTPGADVPIEKFKPKKGLTREKIEGPLEDLKNKPKKFKMRCG